VFVCLCQTIVCMAWTWSEPKLRGLSWVDLESALTVMEPRACERFAKVTCAK